MAAVTVASGYPKRVNAGELNHIVYRLTGVNDGDTLTITNLVGYFDHECTQVDNPTTQASAGVTVSEPASGVFTFYPGEDGADLHFVIKVRA